MKTGTLTKLALSAIGHMKPERARARTLGSAVALPPPERQGGLPLLQAIAARRSSREFSAQPLSPQVLSNVLWAAYGINREQGHAGPGRTAPSAMDAQEIDVYAVLPDGVFVYDARGHGLSLVASADARRVTGYQDFVDEAPLDLVYVADHGHMHAVPPARRLVYSAVCAGAITQNVSLYCASAGLATVVRGWFDSGALSKALSLTEHEHIVIAQTVGYPG